MKIYTYRIGQGIITKLDLFSGATENGKWRS